MSSSIVIVGAKRTAIGALLGRAAEGKLDLRGVLDAIIGRRSSS